MNVLLVVILSPGSKPVGIVTVTAAPSEAPPVITGVPRVPLKPVVSIVAEPATYFMPDGILSVTTIFE